MNEMGITPSVALAGGPVEVRIPAEAALSRIVRLAASGLASLTGFTIDDIETIKIAVSEVTTALIEHGVGDPVDIALAAHEDFTVRARTASPDFDPQHVELELCRAVLGQVCHEHGMDQVEGYAEIWATVVRTG
jgi:hypothetical protein